MGSGPPSVRDRSGDDGRRRPSLQEANQALSISEQEHELDIARFVFNAIAAVCAVASVEFFRWLLKGVGGKVAARHPFITELVEELVDRPWRWR